MKAEWLPHTIDHTNAMSIALGQVLPLLQGLGGYTRGCTDAPPWRKLHTFEEENPQPSIRVTTPRDQASAGLILIPTKAQGLLSVTIIRSTLT